MSLKLYQEATYDNQDPDDEEFGDENPAQEEGESKENPSDNVYGYGQDPSLPISEEKLAVAKILEYITNTFYANKDNSEISINITNKPRANYYDQHSIVLGNSLLDAFGQLNLPRFTVYYHELGHHLYSAGLFKLVSVWKQTNHLQHLNYNKKYEHLVGWIEDFYIEDRLYLEHPYLRDVLSCLKQLPPDYDIKRIEYAFNFWYVYSGATPALSYTDQLSFKAYIQRLLGLRKTITFGNGALVIVGIKKSIETVYIETIVEFHQWCVDRGIFPKDIIPPLANPNNHLEEDQPGNGGGNPNDTGTQQPVQDQDQNEQRQPNQSQPGESDVPDRTKDSDSNKGSYSDHSGQVGKTVKRYHETTHIQKKTDLFREELVSESKMIMKEVLDMSQRVNSQKKTLDGLFATTYEDTAIIQPRVIVPNFFNPNRLVDQVLFSQKQHTYMNVAIFRDISGSTSGPIHRMMHDICEHLFQEIPVDIEYYLYSSGDISIIRQTYYPWPDSGNPPKAYKNDPLFKQLTGGTNSDAIADVVTQQLSDRWLNIVITDGDLHQLMARENIDALLKNVFIVSVKCPLPENGQGIVIENTLDIQSIDNALASMKEEET